MNGILVITYFNHLIFTGHTPLDAMTQAAEQRMRPMLMTALSACIGLLPAALSQGIGSQVQRPLATVVVGGMLIGPVMLLVVAPALQVLVVEWSQKRRQRRLARSAQ
jgi:cobalt-zinc-cadmium resistance protein CzcA